jgi:hypothetical protein
MYNEDEVEIDWTQTDEPPAPPEPTPADMDRAADQYVASQNGQIERSMIRRERSFAKMQQLGWSFHSVGTLGRSVWLKDSRWIERGGIDEYEILNGIGKLTKVDGEWTRDPNGIRGEQVEWVWKSPLDWFSCSDMKGRSARHPGLSKTIEEKMIVEELKDKERRRRQFFNGPTPPLASR